MLICYAFLENLKSTYGVFRIEVDYVRSSIRRNTKKLIQALPFIEVWPGDQTTSDGGRAFR